MSAHPSMLQLDAMALGAGDESTATHVRGCARCSAHAARVQQELPVPAWVRDIGRPRRARVRNRWWLYRWSLIGAVVLFAAGSVLLREQRLKHGAQWEGGSKGMPSIAVYIKRDGTVSLWDGLAPVQAGDALQLKVAAKGYSRITVAALQDGTLSELYAGAASGEGMLPRSWTVDEAPGPEVLLVAFSSAPLTKAGQAAALATLPRTREIWATRLEFVKKGGER